MVKRVHNAPPISFEQTRNVSLSGGMVSSSIAATVSKKYIQEVEALVGRRAQELDSFASPK